MDGVDDALTRLGKFNRWQMLTYSMACLSVTVSGCWHMLSIVFTGGEPDHHCKIPDGQLLNETIPIEGVGRKAAYSKCSMYVNYTIDNTTKPCDPAIGWTYSTEEFESTIVSEWDIVCDKNYLVETSQSVFNFGVMMGAIVFTTLADKIGRKPVHLGCQYVMVLVGLAIAFAQDYITFVILRFFLGAVREGAGLVGIVMACELFPAAQRTFAGAALELFWAASWMGLSGIAFLERNWRNFQLAITIPPAITIVLIWLLPESVPWLVANGRVEEAEAILQRAAKFNGQPVDGPFLKRSDSQYSHADLEKRDSGIEQEDKGQDKREEEGGGDTKDGDTVETDGQNATEETKMLPEEEQPTNGTFISKVDDEQAPPETDTETLPTSQSKNSIKKTKIMNFVYGLCPGSRKVKEEKVEEDEGVEISYSCLDIARSRKLLLYTFVMCSLWFASGVIYYGLSLSTSTLAGNQYVNFFLSGAVEAPAYGMTVIVLQKYGRRWPLLIFHLVAAVVLFVNIFIPEETASGVSLAPLIITLTMIGKFAMTASFGTVVLYAPEIYPTNIRNLGFGLASVWGRIGSMIAPFAAYIGKIVPWIPGLVFTIVALVTGVMTLLLPETLNRPLPETIEEVEGWDNELRVQQIQHALHPPVNTIVRSNSEKSSKGETAV